MSPFSGEGGERIALGGPFSPALVAGERSRHSEGTCGTSPSRVAWRRGSVKGISGHLGASWQREYQLEEPPGQRRGL